MFRIFYCTIVVLICAICNVVPERPNYLTDEDYARAKSLSSVSPNETVLSYPAKARLLFSVNPNVTVLNYPASPNETVLNYPENNTQNIVQHNKREKRNAWRWLKWPNARVPYVLDPSFNNNERAAVAQAFENYHSKTCVRFVAKQSTDTDYVNILRDNSVCGLGELCKRGGAQFAKFGGTCINAGVMTHELGHTLCFQHEQSRPDRDNYISWNTSVYNCVVHEKLPATDWTTFDLLYDYVSLQHYEGECYNGCITPKIPGVTKCGSGGDLSVLDAEKINANYDCGGCYSYRFRPISLITTTENFVGGGLDNGDVWHPCRAYYKGDILVGKGSPIYRCCYVPYNGAEYKITENFEILTNPKNAKIVWRQYPSGSTFPTNAIRGGRSAEREPLYIGRSTVQIDGKVTTVIGKIHRSASNNLYIPYGGREYSVSGYEILVCDN